MYQIPRPSIAFTTVNDRGPNARPKFQLLSSTTFITPAHAMHGSVYFKCLDDAAFFAANSIVQEVFVLTVTFNVVLLRPVAAGALRQSANCVHSTKI